MACNFYHLAATGTHILFLSSNSHGISHASHPEFGTFTSAMHKGVWHLRGPHALEKSA